ncbi:MAG: hypothetical protein AB7I18_11220 [Candidatus Berkiella sp.]
MKLAKIKLPFGINQNGTLVHINDVERGKKCGCICPGCKAPLKAAKGSKIQHHFKHDGIDECKGGLESAIHMAAKKIIKEKMQFTIPECILTASKKDSKGKEYQDQEIIIANRKVEHFDSVEEEKELNGIIPDIVAYHGRRQLIIEICFRNKVDEQKLTKIRNLNLAAIEVDLSDVKQENIKDFDALWLCLNEPSRTKWLHNSDSTQYSLILQSRLLERTRLQDERYKLEEIENPNTEQQEKIELFRAIENIRELSSLNHIEQLNKYTETHPVWKECSIDLPFSWNDLPQFLNMEVSNGDWIFGCDRRIWQTAVYSSFVCKYNQEFSINHVDNWLQNKMGFKVTRSVKIVEIYSRKYPLVIPDIILGNIPSPWVALKDYFNYLCELKILSFSGKYQGDYWFRVSQK